MPKTWCDFKAKGLSTSNTIRAGLFKQMEYAATATSQAQTMPGRGFFLDDRLLLHSLELFPVHLQGVPWQSMNFSPSQITPDVCSSVCMWI